MAYGFLTALVATKSAALAVIMFLAYLLYEVLQHLEERDVLYRDLLEFAVGVALGAAVVVAVDWILDVRPRMWLPP